MLIPYSQRSPGSNSKGVVSAALAQVVIPGVLRGGLVAGDVRAPDLVAEAGGMGQKVAERDRPLGRPQAWLPGRVEALQHPGLVEVGDHLDGRAIEIELAPLDELHGGGRRDGLGHGRDPDDGVCRHRSRLPQRPLPERALVDEPRVGGDRRHDPRHRSGLHGLAEHFVEDREVRHARLLWGGRSL